ncbi:MAG: N-acetyltransferase, partial [Candidatus Heritagella sp.]
CHVCVESGRIEGVFTLIFGEEPTYRVIEQGAWPDEKPYATLHRMASSGRVPRVSDACFSYAKARFARLRVDTHRDNGPMRRAIERNGFVYCGVIHVQDGSARLAYQFTGKEEE